MIVKKVDLEFEYDFKGILKTENHEAAIGIETSTLSPYDMLFGALASCYYSTLLDVAEKKRIIFDSADIHVEGKKRSKIPMTLEWVTLDVVIKGAEKKDENGLIKAAELAAKYCSIYETVSKVADISWTMKFE